MSIVVRRAAPSDAAAIAAPLFELVVEFATSFAPERGPFEASLALILGDETAWLGVAEAGAGEAGAGGKPLAGYCLGFDHAAFYANGRVAWVEEIMVREDARRLGVGAALMSSFEAWAAARGDRLVALATRRAAPFYTTLGYEDSATYFRKLL